MAILEWVMPGNFAQLLHTNTALIGSLTGFLSHRLYFGRGNPHKKDQSARRIIDVLFTCHLLLTSYFVKTDGCSGGLKLSAAFAFFFYLGLFGTLVVYRLWFHPLRKFPGPFWGKVTGFYGLYLARNARYVWETEKLMEEYGVDFLRFSEYRPNSLNTA